VNPWSRAVGAEPEDEEREDRELFQRRVRALSSAPSGVPALADVLRRAGPPRAVDHRGGRFVTFALAAACLAGVWTRLPALRVEEITPVDESTASVAAPTAASGGLMSSLDERLEERPFTAVSSGALASTEAEVCVAEPPIYSAHAPPPARLACEREEFCSVAGQ